MSVDIHMENGLNDKGQMSYNRNNVSTTENVNILEAPWQFTDNVLKGTELKIKDVEKPF